MEKLNSIIVVNSFKLKEPIFCIKTHDEQDNQKMFINFCISNTISPPTIQLDEKELQNLIENESFEELSQFTIPLILEQLEFTKDNKGNSSRLTHAIINDKFYNETIVPSEIYKRFLIYITIETINIKFGLKLNLSSYVIMKNKLFQLPDNVQVFNKFINSYVPSTHFNSHNVSVSSLSNDKPVEIKSDSTETECEKCGDDEHSNVIMNLNVKLEFFEIFIKFFEIVTFENIELLLNDDRIVVKNNNIVVKDFYVSVKLNPDKAIASFKNNILTIQCPVFL